MRSLFLFPAMFAGLLIVLAGCSEETTPTGSTPPPETIRFRFVPVFDSQPLQLGRNYVTAAGDTVTFTTLKFYASEFALVNIDGSESSIEGLALIDFDSQEMEEKGYVSLDLKGEKGTYRGVKFAVGVPSDLNHRDVSTQTEPLGPNSGMYWSWNPGYIFFKIEGRADSMGRPVNFLYHTGEDNRRKTIRLASLNGNDVTEFVVGEDDGHTDHEHNVFTINVDYAALFSRGLEPGRPLSVKMNPGERMNHVGPKDLADRTAANFAEAFGRGE